MTTSKTKKCSGKNGCGLVKPVDKFNKNRRYKDGLSSYCRSCETKKVKKYKENNKKRIDEQRKEYRKKNKEKIAKANKEYYQNNREKIDEKKREYQKNNKEKIAEKKREYQKNNKEKISKQRKKYRVNNKEKVVQQKKRYRANNKEKIALGDQKYRENNKEKIAEREKKYKNNKRKIDLNFKIAENLRNRLYKAIKNNQKAGSAVGDLGCSIPELKLYLEAQFYSHSQTQQEMTWENYGSKWQIDHEKPLALFDLTNREQFLEVCYYTNLQPLWIEDHVIKTAKDIKKIRIQND